MKQVVTKELKEIINWAWWKEIAKLLKWVRDSMAVRILSQMWSDEKQYSEVDLWRRQLKVCNALLNLPNKSIEVEEEISLEEMVADEAEKTEIGDVDDLFTTQDV